MFVGIQWVLLVLNALRKLRNECKVLSSDPRRPIACVDNKSFRKISQLTQTYRVSLDVQLLLLVIYPPENFSLKAKISSVS